MIYVYNSDLLELFRRNHFNAIGHQANCYGVMGAGIALQIRNQFPEAYEADRNFEVSFGKERLGLYSRSFYNDRSSVVNFYGQVDYMRYTSESHTNVSALRDSITDYVSDDIRYYETPYRLGLPMYIGAGLAGGDHKEIISMLSQVENSFEGFEIWLVSLLVPEEYK